MSSHSSSLSPDAERQRQVENMELHQCMEQIKRKILILSGKGGVGKSTVAANLAIALADSGRKVGLLDVDLHGPSIPKILGLGGQHLNTAPDGSILPFGLTENLFVVSVAFLLSSDRDAVIWRGPMKYNVIRQFLKDVRWGGLDVLVIDSPPGTGDEPLAVAQMVGLNASAVIVTTPQEVAIADVRRSVSFCQTLKLPVLGIVENMSGMVCPHCGKSIDVFKTGGGEKLAAEMAVPFLGRIPLDPDVVAGGDQGQPFMGEDTESAVGASFRAAFRSLLEEDGDPA